MSANVQSIIVYRNPLEAWWWESGVGYWATFILIGLVVVFIIWFFFKREEDL